MLKNMGVGVVNPKQQTERLQSLESCFEYSFNSLPRTHKELLAKFALFNSPFPAHAAEKIFGLEDSSEILSDLYDHSLLRRVEFDEYSSGDDDVDATFHLYYFHPAIRNYLEYKVVKQEKKQDLEKMFSKEFANYYERLLKETYNAIGTKDHVLSLERFNVIWQGKDNDFDRAIGLARDRWVTGSISLYLRVLLYALGRYVAALEHLYKSLAIHQELNDRVGMAGDYVNTALVLNQQGNYDQALQYHNKSLAIHQELNDRVRMAGDYGNIGAVLDDQGNYDQALQYVEMALEIHKEINDKVGMAGDYRGIALVLANTKNRNAAIELLSKGLEILKELEEETGYNHPLINIIKGHISELQKV